MRSASGTPVLQPGVYISGRHMASRLVLDQGGSAGPVVRGRPGCTPWPSEASPEAQLDRLRPPRTTWKHHGNDLPPGNAGPDAGVVAPRGPGHQATDAQGA